jgi:2-C-methyl-D-erythritol 4-phosphate cytidylyltransferase
MTADVSAVVVAAGRSTRMGFDKLLTPVAGQPLLQRTLEAVGQSPWIGEVIIVTRPDLLTVVRDLAGQALAGQSFQVVEGGAERQDSVRNGLKASSANYPLVLIQDAARPFITVGLIEHVLGAAREMGAAVCGYPSSDTLKECGPEGVVQRTLDRSQIWAVQTPQIFRKELLMRAYDAVAARGGLVTDDTAAVEAIGAPVRVVLYRELNMKVTTPADWKLAECYYQSVANVSG